MSTPIRTTTLKVSYTAWRKHKKRGDLTFYCRVREAGQPPLDVCLHTTNKAQADAFVMLRKRELELYNAQLLVGENPDASKLLRRSTSKIAQKGTSEAVSVRTAVDAWSAHLSRSGKRPATISTYLRALRNCIDFSQPLSAVTERFLTESLRKHDHLKAATRKSYCVTVREWVNGEQLHPTPFLYITYFFILFFLLSCIKIRRRSVHLFTKSSKPSIYAASDGERP